MLVLSRKIGQALLFGKEIEVTVLRIDGDQVRLGIKAPRRITVLRKELLEEIKDEMTQAQIRPQTPTTPVEDLRKLAERLKANKPPQG